VTLPFRCVVGLLSLFAIQATWAGEMLDSDVCVYGGGSGGFAAAIQAARLGRRVVLLEPGAHVGGMNVEGLGSSDVDNHDFRNSDAIGGIALEFYCRIGKAYKSDRPVWKFEPHVAETVIGAWLKEVGVIVHTGHRLREAGGVVKDGARISELVCENGVQVRARMFIDATIEGDLLAAAGVSTIIGREPNARYGETRNGIRGLTTYRQFAVAVDPWKIPGDRTSGLIATIQDEPLGTPGDGDARIQGYCFRLCLTRERGNRIPFVQPAGYDPAEYEIYRRYIRAGGKLWTPVAQLPDGKTDQGSWHDLSANLYGMNHAYPGGDYATRARILADHRRFTQGLCWFIANDAAVPVALRKTWSEWGVCRDEFTDNAGWPRMFYVRDARRLVNDHVLTEQHLRRVAPTPVTDPVAVAYWPPDTHHVRRIVRDGAAWNEGFVFGGDDWRPFGISAASLTPRESECVNLITTSCPASSHVAYGAIRLEWTFMALGHAAATAAAFAIADSVPIQRVDYPRLRDRLLADGQVLTAIFRKK